MKPMHTLLVGLLALTVLSFDTPPGNLIGRWQQKFTDVTAITIYRPDGMFDILLYGKSFVSGTYRLTGDTLAISDPICGVGYYGTYRLTFITPDSTRQTLIADICTVRSNSMAAPPTNGRLRPTKP